MHTPRGILRSPSNEAIRRQNRPVHRRVNFNTNSTHETGTNLATRNENINNIANRNLHHHHHHHVFLRHHHHHHQVHWHKHIENDRNGHRIIRHQHCKIIYCHKCKRYHQECLIEHHLHEIEKSTNQVNHIKEKEKRLQQLYKSGYRTNVIDFIYRAIHASGHGWNRNMFQLLDYSNLKYLFDYCRHRVYHVENWSTDRIKRINQNLEEMLKKEDKEITEYKKIIHSKCINEKQKDSNEKAKRRGYLIDFIRYEIGGERRRLSAMSTTELAKKARRAVEKRVERHGNNH